MCYLGEAVVSVLFRGSSVIKGWRLSVCYLGKAVVSVLFRGSNVHVLFWGSNGECFI